MIRWADWALSPVLAQYHINTDQAHDNEIYDESNCGFKLFFTNVDDY